MVQEEEGMRPQAVLPVSSVDCNSQRAQSSCIVRLLKDAEGVKDRLQARWSQRVVMWSDPQKAPVILDLADKGWCPTSKLVGGHVQEIWKELWRSDRAEGEGTHSETSGEVSFLPGTLKLGPFRTSEPRQALGMLD